MGETVRRYRIGPRNSTVNGRPGREFDWTLACWDGSAVYTWASRKGDRAPRPYVDDFLIASHCQYLHVPWNYAAQGTIYRVRPNESMQAGHTYQSLRVVEQRAVKLADGWYWELRGEKVAQEGHGG